MVWIECYHFLLPSPLMPSNHQMLHNIQKANIGTKVFVSLWLNLRFFINFFNDLHTGNDLQWSCNAFLMFLMILTPVMIYSEAVMSKCLLIDLIVLYSFPKCPGGVRYTDPHRKSPCRLLLWNRWESSEGIWRSEGCDWTADKRGKFLNKNIAKSTFLCSKLPSVFNHSRFYD